jgi:hypothetical protein
VAGRGFRATDTSDAARVAIVNETFAHHYWPAAMLSIDGFESIPTRKRSTAGMG